MVFACALEEAGFCSWIGRNSAPTSWLVAKWGDVCLHETVISHIRRLLDTTFATSQLHESPTQFMKRMGMVCDHMNSDDFARRSGGGGLAGLAKETMWRCEEIIRLKGERLAK